MLAISLELEEKETKQVGHQPADALSDFRVSENNG
jgi:hypothetical protein